MQLAIVQQIGYTDWEKVIEMESKIDSIFEQAIDTMMDGKYDEFKVVLDQHPHLVHTQFAFGHRASLIHYIAANGVDTHRQIAPYNGKDLLALLLEKGASINATHNIYGVTCSLANLMLSGYHPISIDTQKDLIDTIN
jgi:hypothetical protein